MKLLPIIFFGTLVVCLADSNFRNDCRRPCKRCSDCVHSDTRMLNETTCPSTLKETINCLLESVPAVDIDLD
jgi:hypothetical protein